VGRGGVREESAGLRCERGRGLRSGEMGVRGGKGAGGSTKW